MKHIFTFPPHVSVVGMTSYRGKLLVATNDGLWEWDGENETMQHLDFYCYRRADGCELIGAYHTAMPWVHR